MAEKIVENLFEKIIAEVKKVPYGKVTSYGYIAQKAGIKDARKVGWALHQSKEDIPWHRIVKKGGILPKGLSLEASEIHKALLESEGVGFLNERQVAPGFVIDNKF